MSMTEVDSVEDSASADALQDKYNDRCFQLRDLLRYEFKSPSPYGSLRVKLTGDRRGLRLIKERIVPIAYCGSHNLFGAGGVVSSSGGIRPFVWMTDGGELVVQEFGRYEIVGRSDLVERLTDYDYNLLVFWLSNDATGALNLINKQLNERIDEMAAL